MRLKPEQFERLRKPFDKYGAFEGRTKDEVEEILNGVMNYYLTLANINLRLKREEKNNGTK
ncbi:hypothetical protein A2943_00770 [Candidatus Adlerbacteria bacterium RIFCSPLOWO2_01_FULL_51_16]|uniref:Uncharacterized protein n=1 Tax=Candidatus Adlerbacteria bacterium RIFCSPLOWO2_01_FULL_51_16 TaxID=1797243 RepID=A0A1F4XHR0_9BACT|nr:MAG: hypothetical protein A2943_00770 [Candidatus Adlerbacteria bacterium RIFCSPLOWO2_01_FULL_51_16]